MKNADKNTDNTNLTADQIEDIVNMMGSDGLAALLRTKLTVAAREEISTELSNRSTATIQSILTSWSTK